MAAEWFDELAEFLRIPSISADPAHAADVSAAGEWVCARVREAGGECELVDWHGQPLAIGEIRASQDAGDAPTVLCYGHFDVQPPDPLELWESDPFEPEIRGDYLYGARDRRRQGPALHAALARRASSRRPASCRSTSASAATARRRPAAIRSSSTSSSDERGADAAVIFDSGMIRRDVPAFNVATRGLVYFHVTLRTGERDLHSGMYGGAALNAAHALIRTLERARSPTTARSPSRCATGIARADRRRSSPAGGTLPARRGRARRAGRAAEGRARGRGLLPPHVRGAGARRERHRDRLAACCRRRCCRSRRSRTCRSGSRRARRPTRSRRWSSGCCARRRPTGAELEVELLVVGAAGARAAGREGDPARPRRVRAVLGVRPALIRSGGTLPIVPALADKGIPTVITGFGLPDSQVHSPNERLVAEYVPLGIAAARELFLAFARPVIDLHSHVLPGPRRRRRATSSEAVGDLPRGGRRTGSRCSPRRRTSATTIRRRPSRWSRRLRACAARPATACGSSPAASSTSASSTGRARSCARFALAGQPALPARRDAVRRLAARPRRAALPAAAAGITPVLAHPERNAEVQQRPELLEPLVAGGTLVQLTAASVDGASGGRARAALATLLERGLAHLIASDAHAPACARSGCARRCERSATRRSRAG